MVSPSKPNHSKVANKSTSLNKLVKGPKPLINFKFYLDIENHNLSTKIENKIKELGGTIDFFLAKEITHFVTDKPILSENCTAVQSPATPQTPQTSIGIDVSAISSPTHEAKGTNISKPRSRADAMLQRVRLQNQDSSLQSPQLQNSQLFKRNSQSPVQIAKTFGTPIWTAEYALRFLEKVLNDTRNFNKERTHNSHHHQHNHHHHHKRSHNAKILKGNYIKIESLNSKNYRPVYREFKSWPKIHLSIGNNSSPFDSENKEMTRKNNRNTNTTTTAATVNKANNHQMGITKSIVATGGNTNHENKKEENSDKQCGYCEICRVEYDVLKQHLKSDEHLNFVKNDDNFISLDKLIKDSSNVDKFLNLKQESCHVLITRTSFTRSQAIRETNETKSGEKSKDTKKKNNSVINSNECNDDDDGGGDKKDKKNNEPPPSKQRRINNERVNNLPKLPDKPRKSGIERELNDLLQTGVFTEDETRRSRRESSRRINYAEPKEDDDENSEGTVTVSQPIKTIPVNKRRRSVRWRAPSPDERPPVSKPIMYKVEKQTRSPPKKSPQKLAEPLIEKTKVNINESAGNIKFKIRRVRQSELSLLSDEAENFMFPKREITEPDTDEDRQSTSAPADMSNDIISSDVEKNSDKFEKIKSENENDEQNEKTDKGRKRRNHLELFLNDNTDYYKFENPNSRLRFQETPTQPALNENDAKDDRNNMLTICKPEDRVGGFDKFNIKSKYKYAFERVPVNEPWYNAFQRQDEGKEKIFEYYGSTAYRKLPFEMGPLPPLDKNCCLLSHTKTNTKVKNSRKKLNNTLVNGDEGITTNSGVDKQSPMLYSSSSRTIMDIDEDVVDDATTSKSNSVSTSSEIKTSNNNFRGRRGPGYISKKKMQLLETCHPRKSPREHASTLAILSSIVNNPLRKRNKDSISASSNDFNGDIEENSVDSTIIPAQSSPLTVINENSYLLIENENLENNIESSKINNVKKETVNVNIDNNESSELNKESELGKEDKLKKYLTAQSWYCDVDFFLRHSYNDCKEESIEDLSFTEESDLLTSENSKNDDCDIILDRDNNMFVDILTSNSHDESLDKFIENALNRWTIDDIKEQYLNKKESYKLSKKECCHLARVSRRRYKKNNRTGWPKNRKRIPNVKKEKEEEISSNFNLNNELEENIPISELGSCLRKNTVSSSSSSKINNNNNNNNNNTKNGLINTRTTTKSSRLQQKTVFLNSTREKINSDMFTVSSDSLDSVSLSLKLEKNDEYDSVSTRSLFVSDDSSLDDETIDENPPNSISSNSNNRNLNQVEFNHSSQLFCLRNNEHDNRKGESTVINNTKTTTNVNGLINNLTNNNNSVKRGKKKGVNGRKSYGLRCGRKMNSDSLLSSSPLKKPKSSITTKEISKQTTTTTTTALPATPPSPQFSPRKLRKPRGRWYRER